MKISGAFRSETSAQAWARVRGYVFTAFKHGLNAFDAIHSAITGNPWTPTPSPATRIVTVHQPMTALVVA
jgi:hypothetical protein